MSSVEFCRPCAGMGFCWILLLVLAWSPDSRAEWVRYENDHFIVYSQAKAKRVTEIARELELFRAASLQVFSLRPPPDAPKTLVVLAKHKKEFRDYGGARNIAGFARREGQQTLIVMPASGNKADKMNTVRHEFAHALLTYDEFDYPAWYDEGFAELAALIEIDDEAGTFTIGLGTDRRLGHGEVPVEWNALIDDKFSPHRLTSNFDASAAYGQAWLLMHYLSLGPDAENAKRLAVYVAELKRGVASLEAFKVAFERTPQDFWDSEMHDYTERLPYYRLRFTGLSEFSEFDVVPAPAAEMQGLLDYLTMHETALRSKRIEGVPVERYVGLWAPKRFATQCSEPIDVRFLKDKQRIAFQWEQKKSAGPDGNFVEYSYREDRSGGFLLKQETETGREHNIVPEIVMTYREGDLLCIAHPDDKDYGCDQYFMRCDAAAVDP